MKTGDNPPASSPSPWEMAGLAAGILALSPQAGLGLRLMAPAGPVREAWLAGLRSLMSPDAPMRKMPANIADGAMLGGLDLAATLTAGRPVAEAGLLAGVDGGILLLAMAERMPASTAAKLAAVIDSGLVQVERDGLTRSQATRFATLALDEGLEEEAPPPALLERLAITLDLRALSHREIAPFPFTREDVMRAEALLPQVRMEDDVLTAFVSTSLALGIPSLRAVMQASDVARRLAALFGQDYVGEEEARLAAALVLAPRATRLPAPPQPEEAESAEPPPPEADDASDAAAPPPPNSEEENPAPLEDVVLDAAAAAIPPQLLAALLASGGAIRARSSGKGGQRQKAATRGRVIGTKAGDLRAGARLDVVETLRAAAPWQRLRSMGSAPTGRIAVRREDFRLARYKNHAETVTIFVVDASGSSALQRLGEAKGAVRLLLAECYVRRDQVALITFRGTGAEIALPPTRALTRAQRALAALPGGGGTPIAHALEEAEKLVDQVRRAGQTPMVVLMTDGKANVTRAGGAGRPQAQAEAMEAAKRLGASGVAAILIDTSPQPQKLAEELAGAMHARYLPLPRADAARVARAVSLIQKEGEAA